MKKDRQNKRYNKSEDKFIRDNWMHGDAFIASELGRTPHAILQRRTKIMPESVLPAVPKNKEQGRQDVKAGVRKRVKKEIKPKTRVSILWGLFSYEKL